MRAGPGADRARRVIALALALGLTCVLALSLPGCVHDPPPGPDALAAAAARGPIAADPLFWRIEPDGGATVHLLGSVHIGPMEGWRMPNRIRRAFGRSDTLAVEVDVFAVSPAEMAMAHARHGMVPEGETLADQIPEDLMREVQKYAVRHGIPLQRLERMRPWLAAQTLGSSATGESSFSFFEAVDFIYLTRRGERDVISLETPDDQLAVMGRMPRELEIAMLRDAVGERAGQGVSMLLTLVDAWRRGDEAALAALFQSPFGPSDEAGYFGDAFLFERNAAMAEQITAFARNPALSGQSVFAVIGVGHCVGERNVRALLAAEGLEIDQLGPAPGRRMARALVGGAAGD